MKYDDFERVLSPARLSRYLTACKGDKELQFNNTIH